MGWEKCCIGVVGYPKERGTTLCRSPVRGRRARSGMGGEKQKSGMEESERGAEKLEKCW
jgi:hypothetical protein